MYCKIRPLFQDIKTLRLIIKRVKVGATNYQMILKISRQARNTFVQESSVHFVSKLTMRKTLDIVIIASNGFVLSAKEYASAQDVCDRIH